MSSLDLTEACWAVQFFYKLYPPQGGETSPVNPGPLLSNVKSYMSARTGGDFDLARDSASCGEEDDDGLVVNGFIVRPSRLKARIYIAEEQNHCWRRFTLAKELAHLLIDVDPESYTDDPIGLLRARLVGGDVVPDSIKLSNDSEKTAYNAAIELLLPWQYRWRVRKTYQEAAEASKQSQSDPFESVAMIYRVPKDVIERCLTEPYYSASRHANMQVAARYEAIMEQVREASSKK